ncbi:MAG TPA: ABC transporter ATP-binding protein [Candidatus Dormibacteraeota bacterium]|jgi:ABC-type multidrug transport system ATPase subunit|nr:ABC transporter ATP-binding protein [Candidatus Dormibacteraeota bacterium]
MQTVALVIEMDAGLDAARTELEVHGLWAGYGGGDVLQDYELVVSRGESVRLTGRNGSGKSTLLNCIAGSHRPRAGSILIGGISLMDRPVEAKRLIGISNGTCPFPYLTGREHLDVARRVYNLQAEQVERFIGRFAAWESVRSLDQEVRTYSHGMRQQLALLLATVHEPQLALLDEATDGLDKESQADWSEYLSERSEAGGTLVYVAHKDGVASGFPAGRSIKLSRGQ